MNPGDPSTNFGRDPEDHPSADVLADYAEGLLAAPVAEQAEAHFERCDECRSLVQDLADYPSLEPPGEAYKVSEAELRSTLGALRANLVTTGPEPAEALPFARPQAVTTAEGREPSNPPDGEDSETAPGRWVPLWPLLAAALILASLGGAWHFARSAARLETLYASLENDLQEIQAENRRPWPNPEITQLLPTDDPLRSPQGPTLSLATTQAVVVVPLIEPLPAGTYEGEIRNPAGETVLRVEGLVPQNIGLTFMLSPKALAPGRYLLWIVRDGEEAYPTPFELRISD